jgi:hypothetical protein
MRRSSVSLIPRFGFRLSTLRTLCGIPPQHLQGITTELFSIPLYVRTALQLRKVAAYQLARSVWSHMQSSDSSHEACALVYQSVRALHAELR